MNQDLLTKAQELQKQGYSIRQIAAELAISKSQVFRKPPTSTILYRK